jgi:predicted enzyme related to lactoylglutathione lyase
MELWTNEMEASLKFYQEMGAYQQEVVQPLSSKAPYVLLKKDGKYAAGVIKNPVAASRAHWVPYFRVADVKVAMEAVHQNGGKILLAPDPAIRNGSVGIALDPSGAPFALQQYQPSK